MIYYVAASLDAFIAPPDGSVDWLSPFEVEGEDYGYAEFYASIDAVLLGSRTYEQSRTFGQWPYSEKPCWVFSKRSLDVPNSEVTVTSQSPIQVLAEMQSRGLKRVWLVGGGQLAASFRAEGLFTEYIVSIIPVTLGNGVPLFTLSKNHEILKLIASQQYPNGVVQLRYKPSAVG